MKNDTKTKLCKYCKTEIPKAAKVCPNCRKKQRGKGGLIALIIIIVIIILIVIGSSGGSDNETKIDNSSASVGNDQNTTSVSESEDSDAESGKVLVGGNFEVDGLKVTVNDAVVDYQVEDDEYGFYELEDGLMYVSVSFTFENTGDSDKYVSIYDFDCYADNTLCEQQYIGGDDFINANLSGGRNVSFTTYYAVPKNAESIDLEYTENVWTDEKLFIQILP